MTHPLFQFGEHVAGYDIPVMNERAVRGAAGILFFIAMANFMQAMLLGNFGPTRVFVVAFLIDFVLRVLVNPKFSPSLIVAQWMVRHQEPEYVAAAPKRMAWSIGLGLALLMFYLIVLKGVIGPVNMLVCGTCLLLMFFESAFGICLGCKLYDKLSPNPVTLCPGNVCGYIPPKGAGGNWVQMGVLLVFGVLVVVAARWMEQNPLAQSMNHHDHRMEQTIDPAEQERCRVPEFAKKIGHEQQWKLHNGCQ
jgi:hypothetical protein